MFFIASKFHLYFWQMCTLFANKLYAVNTYFDSPVWIMMVFKIFDAQNLHFICLQISPKIFAILQNFPINNLRDQQFCTLLIELERPVVVLFTGITLEVEVPPGMVWPYTKPWRELQKSNFFSQAYWNVGIINMHKALKKSLRSPFQIKVFVRFV